MATFAEQTRHHVEECSISLESVVAPWPIAACISQHLPVGDLISLARTNIALRASLHGFGIQGHSNDTELVGSNLDPKTVRGYLNIGFHDTLYWSRLKDRAPFECASTKHTKGGNPRPCRYCSRPICEACVVKDSFLHPKENTFSNRCRSLCLSCWENGNVSKSRRFPLLSSRQHQGWYGHDEFTDEVCTCTLKNDAHLCIPCKNLQNTQATSEGAKQCHGHGCTNPVGQDSRRRRICTWCHKPLPGHLGGAARHEWNQKFIEARKMAAESRQADLEEYNTKRLKLLRMSRRELRGDEAVKDDQDADTPQYVRHLDTLNYRRFMPENAAPSGNEVYQSKKGYWMYSQEFLKHIGRFCRKLPSNQELASATGAGASIFARTNSERRVERKQYTQIRKELRRMLGKTVGDARLDECHNLKAVILDLLVVQRMDFPYFQMSMFHEYGFLTEKDELSCMIAIWGHTWARPRSRLEPELEPELDQQVLDWEWENGDLQFAIQLQEQMDRETAEVLQYTMFNDEDSEDARNEEEPSSTQRSSTDENSVAGPQSNVVHDAFSENQSQINIAATQPRCLVVPSFHEAGSSKAQHSSQQTLGTDGNGTSSAHQGESSTTTRPLPNDDPPPYGPPGISPKPPFDMDWKQAQAETNAIDEYDIEDAEDQEKGKGKGKETDASFMAFHLEDGQDDGDIDGSDEGNGSHDEASEDADEKGIWEGGQRIIKGTTPVYDDSY